MNAKSWRGGQKVQDTGCLFVLSLPGDCLTARVAHVSPVVNQGTRANDRPRSSANPGQKP
jgi:hypothetical protein